MTEEKTTQTNTEPVKKMQSDARRNRHDGDQGGMKKNTRRRRRERVKPEFDQKIINIRRVTRVVRGGRRFSFSVAIVAGDRRGRVGVGIGKAGDTSLAIDKALRNARRHMITLKLNKEKTIPYEVDAKYASSIVVIRPAPGRGVIAGSSVRSVIELAGITGGIGAKLMSRSKNGLNNAKAAVEALKKLPGTTVA